MFEVNLLPWREYSKGRKQSNFYKICLAFLLFGSLLGYLYSLYVDSQHGAAKANLEKVEQDSVELEIKLVKLKEYEQLERELNAKISSLEILESQRYVTASRFNILPTLINEGIALESINSDESGMRVSGMGLDEFSVSTFMRSLNQSAEFDGSGVEIIQQAKVAKKAVKASDKSGTTDVLKFTLKVSGSSVDEKGESSE
jgi:type IV pilus assembly protein PilN